MAYLYPLLQSVVTASSCTSGRHRIASVPRIAYNYGRKYDGLGEN